MADVFISYKSEDRNWAEKIDTLVTHAGYSTWWDHSLVTGQRYNDMIDEQLRLAAATIVIWSQRSWASRWVKEEALISRDRDILLPARIDEVSIGVPFYSLHTADLRNWNGGAHHKGADDLLIALEKLAPRKLREDYSINVYWITGDTNYTGKDKLKVKRFLERVSTACSSIDVDVSIIDAWDHIVNPFMIADRSVYERDLHVLLMFGTMEMCGFFEDVYAPGLRHLARELRPYVIYIEHDDFEADLLNAFCFPDRRVETISELLPEPDTLLGDSVVEAVSSYVAIRALKVKRGMTLRSKEIVPAKV